MTLLRPATERDAQAIATTEGLARADGWEANAVSGSLQQPSDCSWVYTSQELIVGHILSRVMGEEAEVLSIAVRPAYRRQGIGNALLQTCTTSWSQAGVQSGFLEVRASNAGARGLYAAAGWQETGTRPGYYRDGEAAILMRWGP